MSFFTGKVDPFGLITSDIAKKAELKLEYLKQELAKKFHEANEVNEFHSGLGGDPFFYFMTLSDSHTITVDGRLNTAATTGNQYFWNPFFVDVLSPAGLRFVLGHEIAHTFLNHVPRLKDRHPSIHNWCVDFFANNLVLADLKQRFENLTGLSQTIKGKDYFEFYKESMHCTNPMTFERVKAYMLDPVGSSYDCKTDVKMKMMFEDQVVPNGMKREVAYKAHQDIAYAVKNKTFEFFFEKSIPQELKTPEALYDDLARILKKCPNCNRVGMFPVPKKVRDSAKSLYKQVNHKYPTSDQLINLLKDCFKKHKIKLEESGNELSDAELTNERRFLDAIQGSNAVKQTQQRTKEVNQLDQQAVNGNKPEVSEEELQKNHEDHHKALDEFFELAQDLFYAAVKQSVFFEHAKIPDQVIKEGRANPQYNIHFLKQLINFTNYLMSELDAIEKNRSIDDIFDVLKKSVNNTLAGYHLIKAKMTHNLGGKDITKEIKKQRQKEIDNGEEVDDEEDTAAPYNPVTALPDSSDRKHNSDEDMFQLIKGNTQSILSEFDLWGGYSEYIDSLLNEKWVNVEALDCPDCCHKVDIFKFNESKMIYHPGSGKGGEEGDGEDEDGDSKTGNGDLADAIAKNKLMNALMYAKQAGYVPAGFEEAIGRLSKSNMRWQDNFRTIRKNTEENGRNDYTRFKSKHFTLGLLTPKKIDRVFKVAVLCDTSGSMDMQNDITKGISQLTNLSGASGYLTWADAEIYWDKTINLDKFSADTLKCVKVTGRGGTEFLSYFNEYEKRFKDDGINMIVVITDGFLYSGFDKIKKPKVPVMWLITNHGSFSPPFGKVFNIHNE